MKLSYPRTFVPGNESFKGGTFILGNFRPFELSFPDTDNYWTPYLYR